MTLVIFLIGLIGAFLVLLSGLAFFRAKDVYISTHVAMIFGCYAMPVILLAIGLEKFSATALVKILLLIILNLIGTNLLCYLTTKRALSDGIVPDVVAEISRSQ